MANTQRNTIQKMRGGGNIAIVSPDSNFGGGVWLRSEKSRFGGLWTSVYEETNEREETQQCFLESCGVCVDPLQRDELDVPTLAPHGRS